MALESWAEDEGKRRGLFEWALKRAEEAAKVPTQMEAVDKSQQVR